MSVNLDAVSCTVPFNNCICRPMCTCGRGVMVSDSLKWVWS